LQISLFRIRMAAVLVASAAMFAAAHPAAAQAMRAGTRPLGIAGSGIASARGQEALFSNPANLGLGDAPAWSFALPQLTLGVGASGVPLGDVWDARQYDDLSAERRRRILDDVPADGVGARFDTRQPLASMSMGRFAMGVSYANSGEHTIGRDLVELFFEGYQTGRRDYSVEPTHGVRASYWDVATGYGRQLGPLSIGAAGHYYFGATRVRTRLFEPTFDLLGLDLDVDYVGALSRGGRGWGADLGAAYQPMPGLTLSAAIENLASKLTWSDELRVRSLTLHRADFEHAAPDDLLDRYRQSERAIADLAAESPAVRATAAELIDDTKLPARLRLGAEWMPDAVTSLTVAWEEELSAGALVGGWERVTAVGAERRFTGTRSRGIVARAGYATDFDGGRLLSAGVSLGPVQLAVARTHDRIGGDAERRSYDGWVASLGLVAKGFFLK
jgi:hypothetical protein